MAIYLVPTPSMEPTIMSQDFIVAINPHVLKSKTPLRNEVWLFSKPSESTDSNLIMVKRLYGSPGDTIQFVKGNIIVNGVPNSKAKFWLTLFLQDRFPILAKRSSLTILQKYPGRHLTLAPYGYQKKELPLSSTR